MSETLKLNTRFCLPREELEDRIKANFHQNFGGYDQIVPARDVKEAEHIALFQNDVLNALLSRIPLRRDGDLVFPYEHAKFDMYSVEPKALLIGQTFVLEEKLLSIMFDMGKLFSSHVTKGISKMPPVQIYGRDGQENKVMAFYIPPLVEKHGEEAILLDGLHRSTICSSAGTTICSIHISGVAEPLPFDPISWGEVRLFKEKPSIDRCYVNLKRVYFRDLSYVGIDG